MFANPIRVASNHVLDVIQLLIERGADVDTPNKDHITPLHLASLCQHLELVRVLLDHGANVHAEDSQGLTPLHKLFTNTDASKDVLGVVQVFLERGTDVNTPTKDHITPLHMASYHQHVESVRVLLDHGANVNAEDSQGWTALHRVFENPGASKDVLVLVQLLLERGADVNALTKDHITPLHLASSILHLESVRVLLDHGANFHAEDSQGWTALHKVFSNPVASKDVLVLVQLLLVRGADVNTRNKNHITPLHLAAYHQHTESAQVLLNHGANVHAKDNMGQTPLHGAFFKHPKYYPGDYVIPQLLLRHGADVNARDGHHQTPLHLALCSGCFEGPWVLLKHEADLNVENKEGKTPFQLAQERLKEEMRGASPESFHRIKQAERALLMSLLYKY